MALNDHYCSPDFNEKDFHDDDFFTLPGGFSFRFRDYLFGLLPVYFKRNDTYKDKDDKGLLERYLMVFGNELDYQVIPKITCYLHAIDAAVCDAKFLDPLSQSLGNPPDIFQDDEIYRNLLQYVVTFYKIKGTIASYKLFFAILGYDVEIEELPHEDDDSFYDSEAEYDTGEERHTYDRNACLVCYYYNINIKPLDPNAQLVVSTSNLNKLKEAIYFNEPINCKLGTFTSTLTVQDSITVSSGTKIENIMNSVDIIKAKGPFGNFSKPIVDKIHYPNENKLVFTTIFEEEDFNGEIRSLDLAHTQGYIMAFESGLSIVKDSESRVKINWEINITYN